MSSVLKIALDKAARAMRVCFYANLTCALWGRRGVGKSSVVLQSVPKGWGFYDFRLSDKEASDVGGIPFPVDSESGSKRVEYLMTKQLPFDSEEKCVVLLDEFDRTADLSVQNAALQLTLDRRINGHPLSPNARIVIAGNGATDVGTIPLSSASAGRMVHLYIETDDEQARNAWQQWAKTANLKLSDKLSMQVSPMLQSFAEYKSDVWTSAKDIAELEEYGSPTPRTFVMADTLFQACKQVNFETADILLPLLAGCVGMAAATEMLGWYKVCESAPTVGEIIANPRSAKLPDQLGVQFALGLTLARHAKALANGEVDSIATYIARWSREQARFAFTHLIREQPRAATSKAYLNWEKQQ